MSLAVELRLSRQLALLLPHGMTISQIQTLVIVELRHARFGRPGVVGQLHFQELQISTLMLQVLGP